MKAIWRDWSSKQLNKFDADDWIKLTPEMFNDFRVNQLPDIIRASGANLPSSGGPSVGGIITSNDVQLFQKSIVKSNADFPDFNGHASKWNITKQNYKAIIAKAKEARNAQVNAVHSSSNDVPPNQDNNVFSVSSELAPTFREIMSASKIEKKASADGDTWIRIVKS